ncbi:carbohydrate-binding protein [Enterobacter asburiae]
MPPDNGAHTGWRSSKVYISSDVVSWKGKEYKARQWTQGNGPGNH